MTVVKICGLTRREDADQAAALGASFLGFVMWRHSPRYIPLDRVRNIVRTLPASVTPVGVFVNPTADEVNAATDAGISVAQIHGESNSWHGGLLPGVEVIRAVHLAKGRPDTIEPDVPDHRVLLDAHDPVRQGGTGTLVDWSRARVLAQHRQVILAGGLTPQNVSHAIAQVRPYAVDVASGVESRPGVKDHELMRAFIAAAKGTGT